MLFAEWDKTFRYVYGGVLDEARVINDFEIAAKEVLKSTKKIEVDRFLFAIYTYYAFVVKLFASEIACIGLRIYPESPIRILLETEDILEELRYIEEGEFYTPDWLIEMAVDESTYSGNADAKILDPGCDSIITPTTEGQGKLSNDSYVISTVEGIFTLPKSLIDRNLLPQVLRVFEMGIHTGYSQTEIFLLKEMLKIGLSSDEKRELEVFYEKLQREQFRRFAIDRYDGSTPVKCERVQDLIGLNPFGQGQETCVATLTKGAETIYPDSSGYTTLDAYPDPAKQTFTAKWITIPVGKKLPEFSTAKNAYPARHGVVNDLNTVFIVEVLEESSKGAA
eukprot:gene1308-1324_t